MQDNLSVTDMLQNMKAAGCSKEQMENFLHYVQQNDKENELCILAEQRKKLLGEMHDIHDSIEALSQIIHSVRNCDSVQKPHNG